MRYIKYVSMVVPCLWIFTSYGMEATYDLKNDDDGFFSNLFAPWPSLTEVKSKPAQHQKNLSHKPMISTIHTEKEWHEVITAAEKSEKYREFLCTKLYERLVPEAIEAIIDIEKILIPIDQSHDFNDLSEAAIFSIVRLLTAEKMPESLITYLEDNANNHHSWAWYNLGWMYGAGKGVPQDLAKSMDYYTKAIQRGHALSHYEIARAFEQGLGVTPNLSTAIDHYQRAARKLACAQFMLAVFYETGNGLPQDDHKAYKLYIQASKHGYGEAKKKLKVMYKQQRGIPITTAEALKYYERATQYGFTYGLKKMGELYERGEGVPKDDDTAAHYFLMAAEQGDHEAQYTIAHKYYAGIGVPRDGEEAVKWFKLAAAQGNSYASYWLGTIYYKGLKGKIISEKKYFYGITEVNYSQILADKVQAYRYFCKAAEHGIEEAKTCLRSLFKKQKGIPSNESEQFQYYLKAASYGFTYAQIQVGYRCHYGIGTEQNFARAAHYYLLAGGEKKDGDHLAQNNLGLLYEEGKGVSKDQKKAAHLFQFSATQGSNNGRYNLARMREAGTGAPKDLGHALELYYKAAKEGHQLSLAKLDKLSPERARKARRKLGLGQ